MNVISICLSDIPKDLIKKADNGKSYISLIVDKRREPDNYGNTHTVYIQQSKEEREQKKSKVYIGHGKEYLFDKKQESEPAKPIQQNAVEDDLPF